MWCEKHQRPLEPDGTCLLCVGSEGPSRGERWALYIVLGIVLLGGAIPGAYFIWKGPPWQEAEARKTPSTPPPARPSAAPERRRPASSWADKVAADQGGVPAPRLQPEVTVTPLARARPSARRAGSRRSGRRARPRRPGFRIQDDTPKVQITVYIAPWCGYCRKAQRWLRAMKIPHQAIDIERSTGAKRALLAINPRGSVPTFVVGKRVIVGFNPTAVLYAIKLAKNG